MGDWRTNYWAEALSDSLMSHGITLTTEQVDAIAGDLAASAENESMASGLCVPMTNPLKHEMDMMRQNYEYELAERKKTEDGVLHNAANRLGGQARDYYLDRDGNVCRKR